MKPSSLILARQHGDRTAETINKILSNIVGYKKLLLDGGAWVIDADVTIPSHVSLEIFPDAVVTVSTGMTFTVDSETFIVHRADWYAGAGSVAGSYTGGMLTGTADYAIGLLAAGISTGLEMDGEKIAVILSSILNTDEDKAATPKLVSDTFDLVTEFAPATYAGGESVTFPNGMVFKQGFVADVDQTNHTKAIPFAASFDNDVISVSVIPACSAQDQSEFHVVGTPAISGFDVAHLNGDTLTGWFWQAWGY